MDLNILDTLNKIALTNMLGSIGKCQQLPMNYSLAVTTKKDTSVTFWAERNFFCHAYDTSMTIIVTKPGIIIDVVGSYFYDKKS